MRQRVARYVVDMLRNPNMKYEKKSTIVGWYKPAVVNRTESKSSSKLLFPLPFKDSVADVHERDGACSNVRGIIDTLKDAKVCQQGMRTVMGVSDRGMKSIRKAAPSATLVAPPHHGLSGKASNHSLDPEMQSALEDHFATLCRSAIPEHEMGLQTNLGFVYLPESDEYRSYQTCYQQFAEGQGNFSGGLGDRGRENQLFAEQKQKVSYQTYRNTWERKYPHLKLMKQRGKAEKEGNGYGWTALKGGDTITGDLGGGEGGGIYAAAAAAAADGSGTGGGAIIDDADVAVEYDDFGGGGDGFQDESDSSIGQQGGKAGGILDTPVDDGLRGGFSGDDGGANIDTVEADNDDIGGDNADVVDIDGEGGGEGGGGSGGGGITFRLGGKARGILYASTDDGLRRVGIGGGGGETTGTVDADNDHRTCVEVTETVSVIGGNEERKNEVMAGKHSTKNDGHTCTLDESNSFMMTNQPKNAYLTPKRRENLIDELKKSKNIWDGLIGGQMKKGDKHTRWHVPQLSTSHSLLSDQVEACMKDYIAIVQERYPDLKLSGITF